MENQLSNKRSTALEKFSVPEQVSSILRRDEGFRYTKTKNLDFPMLFSKGLSSVTQASNTKADLIPQEYGQVDPKDRSLVILDSGKRDGDSIHIDPELQKQGVKIWNLQNFSEQNDFSPEVKDKIQSVLSDLGPLEEDPFAVWAAEKFFCGLLVYVPKNVKIEGILRIVHSFRSDSKTALDRVLLYADENSQVTYVDEYVGSGRLNGQAPFSGHLVQLVARKGARVIYHLHQNFGFHVESFLRHQLVAFENAKIQVLGVQAGGGKTQTRMEYSCQGEFSEVEIQSVCRVWQRQHLDFWANASHLVPHTKSSLRHFAVIDDQAHSVFNGNIFISQKGVKTDASQKNRNILLSKKATVHSLPKLEIATDDVMCAHGATTSPVQEDQVFYLESRGLEREVAKNMIIDGFMRPVLSQLPTQALQKRAESALRLSQKLEEGEFS